MGVQTGLHRFFVLLLHLGPGGLFVLGILDSSFLFLPLGNDLLITALTANHRTMLPIYVFFASLGSTTGVLLLDIIARNGGEKGLEKIMNRRRLEYLKEKMSSRAGLPVALACIAPPPFPFTPVVAAASVFNYPRRRLLAIVFIGRLIRFTLVGLLAISLGNVLIRLSKTNVFVGIMIAVIAISVVGSTLSILRWLRQSRRAERK